MGVRETQGAASTLQSGKMKYCVEFILRWGCAQLVGIIDHLIMRCRQAQNTWGGLTLKVDVPYMWKFEYCWCTQMLMYAYTADVRSWFKLKRFLNLGKSISPMVDEIWQTHILGKLGDIPIYPCRCYSMTKIILKKKKKINYSKNYDPRLSTTNQVWCMFWMFKYVLFSYNLSDNNSVGFHS